MRLFIVTTFLTYLAGCSFGATAPLIIAGLGVKEYGELKSEIRAHAQACRATESDLLPRSANAIAHGKANQLVSAYLSIYANTDYDSEIKAQALYQVGLIYMNQYNEDRDETKAIKYFNKLKVQFPSSVLCANVDERLAILKHR